LRALTVHQPWAAALVRGSKRIENRCWRTAYRGPLIIHAALRGKRFINHVFSGGVNGVMLWA
jgi:hypothetical protein